MEDTKRTGTCPDTGVASAATPPVHLKTKTKTNPKASLRKDLQSQLEAAHQRRAAATGKTRSEAERLIVRIETFLAELDAGDESPSSEASDATATPAKVLDLAERRKARRQLVQSLVFSQNDLPSERDLERVFLALPSAPTTPEGSAA